MESKSRNHRAMVIPTMCGRATDLIQLIRSITKNCNNWDLLIVAQEYPKEKQTAIQNAVDNYVKENNTLKVKMFFFNKPQGCFGARKRAYEQTDYEIYLNLDDDMEIFSTQGYDEMEEFLVQNKQAGFISGNWGRTNSLTKQKIPKMKKEFKKSPVVHTAGGLMFRKKIKELIINLPDNLSYEDSEMTALAYSAGYENYRYLGSLITHRVVTKGGLSDWRKKYKGELLLGGKLFNYKETKKKIYQTENNDFCEPTSSDLSEYAKQQHKLNKEKINGK